MIPIAQSAGLDGRQGACYATGNARGKEACTLINSDAAAAVPGSGPALTPVKLTAEAIFAVLDRAPFGRLTSRGPRPAGPDARPYVVPLQFVRREGRLYLITRPGRKVSNLRGAPAGVCFLIDLAALAGWISISAWGTYREIRDGGEQVAALLASFGKYPARTLQQGLRMLRPYPTGPAGAASERGDFVVGVLELTTMAGRQWPGLGVPPDSPLLRPGRAADLGERGRPRDLTAAECTAVLDARPLARLGGYDAARGRAFCLPLWFIRDASRLWFYHPAPDGALLTALAAGPVAACAQVDSLDCRPQADPAQPWISVLAEGPLMVVPLGTPGPSAALRARLTTWGMAAPFAPPDPAPGVWLRLDVAALSGVATG